MAMQKKTLQKCIDEANKFIKLATDLQLLDCSNGLEYKNTPKEQGKVKRASMDLTRALADLRQGQ